MTSSPLDAAVDPYGDAVVAVAVVLRKGTVLGVHTRATQRLTHARVLLAAL